MLPARGRALAFTLALLAGCRSESAPGVVGEAPQRAASVSTAPQRVAPVPTPEARTPPDATPPPAPAPSTPLPDVPADTSIELVRTACFGDCPQYRVSIQADGTVLFKNEGLKGGCATRKIARQSLAQLVELIRSSDYFRMEPNYHARATDHPSANTSITLDGRTHRVTHNLTDSMVPPGPEADARKRLTALEHEIDAVAGTQRWLKGPQLPDTILLTRQQIESAVAVHAAELAECRDDDHPPVMEMGIVINTNQVSWDPQFQTSRIDPRVTQGRWKKTHPARECVWKQVRSWSFPQACGLTDVSLKIDLASKPPKISVGQPQRVPGRTSLRGRGFRAPFAQPR